MKQALRSLALLSSSFMVLLSGCSQLSPQLISLNTDVESAINAPVTLSVSVTDNRADNIIGYRGGVYSDTSTIQPKEPLQDQVADIVSELLVEGGATLTNAFPLYDIEISIDEFSYKTEPQKANIMRSTAVAEMSIFINNGAKSFKNGFRTSEYIETFGYPNEQKNEQLLNGVFSSVIERMLSDPALEKFLAE
ncbi:YajG family lipoprotein [Reinekea thalattae]|uniref:Lipoprotein n=1 Tax=Reinekea thalattae TaxID=2593301 RepID=A0A5C8Z7Z9_9GAMM|nr:YajG family lipoprotein [Reinekea thalattae]TXR53423.1 hypothetical protein FME95_02310 [Reinekea thalattae]